MDALALSCGAELRFDLTHGFVAVVDAERFEQTLTYHFRNGTIGQYRPSSLRWWALKNRNFWYAFALKSISLHRLLTEAPSAMLVDHVNADTMDNRLTNLRVCTHKQNARNMVHSRRGSSSFRGVCNRGKYGWQAQIHLGHPNDRVVSLGHFDTEEDAARAWDEAAKREHGEFARLNFPSTPTT